MHKYRDLIACRSTSVSCQRCAASSAGNWILAVPQSVRCWGCADAEIRNAIAGIAVKRSTAKGTIYRINVSYCLVVRGIEEAARRADGRRHTVESLHRPGTCGLSERQRDTKQFWLKRDGRYVRESRTICIAVAKVCRITGASDDRKTGWESEEKQYR